MFKAIVFVALAALLSGLTPITSAAKDTAGETSRIASLSGAEPSRLKQGLDLVDRRKVETVVIPDDRSTDLLSRDPFRPASLRPIRPLYTEPAMPGEGIWESATGPRDRDGNPIVYRTFYRPSVEFPNAIVFMMVIDMTKVRMRYYVGSQEPAAREALSAVEPDLLPNLVAITNAMWQQRHSAGAGAIFRGKQMYPMVDGMATLIVYLDGSVDIQEWGPDIPEHWVQDARQLRHLIVKNGMVVRSVARQDKLTDPEIGLGFLLGKGGKNADGKRFWYIAHRSAFGIRKDGNLVFAIGHHIGTKDLAKALVLAGCERGIHADANPDNIVANLFLKDSAGNLIRKLPLSPEQSKYSLRRYDDGYTKDYFALFLPSEEAAPQRTRQATRDNKRTLRQR